jgi:hypothetical protein
VSPLTLGIPHFRTSCSKVHRICCSCVGLAWTVDTEETVTISAIYDHRTSVTYLLHLGCHGCHHWWTAHWNVWGSHSRSVALKVRKGYLTRSRHHCAIRCRMELPRRATRITQWYHRWLWGFAYALIRRRRIIVLLNLNLYQYQTRTCYQRNLHHPPETYCFACRSAESDLAECEETARQLLAAGREEAFVEPD